MGSLLFLIIADCSPELHSFNSLPFNLGFYFRYVDDIAIATQETHINHILKTFNAYHPRLKFTLKIDGDTLNFLDTIIKKDNLLITD